MTRLPLGAFFLLGVGCARSLPPVNPPPPGRLSLLPPQVVDRMGHITIDIIPTRVRVDEVVNVNPRTIRYVTVDYTWKDGHVTSERYETHWVHVTDRRLVPLCEAPCALDLPFGVHDLHLQSMEDGRWANLQVEATSAPRTYRVGLGRSGWDGISQFLLGLALFAPSVVLLTAAGVDWAAVDRQIAPMDHDRVQRDSIGLTAAGAGLLVAGIVGFIFLRPPEQETSVVVDSR
jgi:hypothetical protein